VYSTRLYFFRLQKESTVVLWKREKQKLIGSIYSRERGLEKELQSTAVEADDTKYRLQRRIEDLQNKLRKEQVRNSTKSGISLQEATTLRRNLFLKERLYVVAESELKKQQSYYLGIMKGLQRDHKIAKANERDNLIKGELATSPLLESRTSKLFIERLDMVVKAMGKGTITKLRSSLPAHYLGYDNPKGPAQRPNLTRDTTEFIVKTTMEEEVNLESTEISSSLVKWRLNEDESQPTLGKLLRDIQKEHPTFVDEEGRLMVKSVAKYFPMLSEEKIMHYFSLFSMWDDNGDLNLDTSEILHNLPGMLGHLSTTEEVADAIREIDIDESGTIDFYEFLLLIKMLHEGGCKSSFFQKNDFLKVSSQVSDSNSKICAIQ
jgi:Ca2+-binding protein (EF-Hand superfamily)